MDHYEWDQYNEIWHPDYGKSMNRLGSYFQIPTPSSSIAIINYPFLVIRTSPSKKIIDPSIGRALPVLSCTCFPSLRGKRKRKPTRFLPPYSGGETLFPENGRVLRWTLEEEKPQYILSSHCPLSFRWSQLCAPKIGESTLHKQRLFHVNICLFFLFYLIVILSFYFLWFTNSTYNLLISYLIFPTIKSLKSVKFLLNDYTISVCYIV